MRDRVLANTYNPCVRDNRSEILARCGGGRFRRQFLVNQRFYLAPHLRIALDFGVRFYQDPVEPRISLATDGPRPIVIAEVSQDFRMYRIGGPNLGSSVHDSIRLVEIDRLPDVGGNHGIILTDLGDAIHLNGEQDGNTISLQLACQSFSFRGAPAMA